MAVFGSVEPPAKISVRRASRRSERARVKFIRIAFEPAHSIDQEHGVHCLSGRVIPLQNLSDSFKGPSRLGFGAGEPRFKAPDRVIERVRNSARAASIADACLRAIRSRRPAAASRRASSVRRPVRLQVVARTGVVQRSPRRANRQGACRRAGPLRRRRRGSAGPRPRYSTPSLYSCPDHRSEAANCRMNEGAPPAILSGVMVKKRLRGPDGRCLGPPCTGCIIELQQLSVANSIRWGIVI